MRNEGLLDRPGTINGDPWNSWLIMIQPSDMTELDSLMTAQQYDEIVKRLQKAGAGHPAGRQYHACFGTPESVSVFDVWTSQAAGARWEKATYARKMDEWRQYADFAEKMDGSASEITGSRRSRSKRRTR